MRTYRNPGGAARGLRLLGALVLSISTFSTARAQDRKYLFEVGLGGAYQIFGDSAITDLKAAPAALGRVGVWLPLNFGLELEGTVAKPKTKSANQGVPVKSGTASLLYNLPLGLKSWAYAKVGYWRTRYSDPDNCRGAIICGNARTYLFGIGLRYALSPLLMARLETAVYPNKGTTVRNNVPETIKFTNYGINLGLSLMLGSKPLPDQDQDGVPNNRDRCGDTPQGAQVDGSGCPQDNDADGVANGLDRCPNTATGAIVDTSGCTRDSDNDNIADGVDKCPDTPAGVLVDPRGCPKDSDGDSIADGLDRCSDTPRGATVDALGCPGDEDGDGVLDGLDRCPRTASGATVNAYGCVPGQQPGRSPTAAPPPAQAPQSQPRPSPQAQAPNVPSAPMVLEGVTFESGSARLLSGSYVELDSIAKVLVANPNMRVEIGGHTDNAGSPADNQHLSSLRAEAVRNYLVVKGVPYQQVVARGYGATQPRTPDTSPRGRAANRRVEIKPLPPGESP
jgi:outer membrane protein OmpA-like peptidoglycan-associated protein